MSGLRRMAIAGVALATLAGCSKSPGTIFNQFTITEETQNAVALDARQRVVIANAPNLVSPPGLSVPRRIVCAEPSPDVAIALANSFGVGLELFGKGAGSAARGQAEGLAQLAERTITIQLLREEMYRVCEAFSNGGLTRTTYSLLLAKLNDTVVTMLLGETAGGRFGAAGAAIATEAEAEASASFSSFQSALENIEDVASKLAAANEKVAETERTLATEQKTLTDEMKATPDGDHSTQTEARDNAQTARDQAVGERDALERLLRDSFETAAKVSAAVKTASGVGSIVAKPSSEIASVLADMQSAFLFSDASQIYVWACLVELGAGTDDPNTIGQAKRLIDRALSDLKIDSDGEYPYDALQQVHLGHMLTRRSGLYQHCQTHLAGFLSDAQGNNASLRAARIDARRADNVARAAQEQLAARRQSDDVGNTTAGFVALARAKSLRENLLTEVAKFSDPDLTIRTLPTLPHQQKSSDNRYRACTEDRLALLAKIGNTVGKATAIADKVKGENDVRLKALAGEQRDLAVKIATAPDGAERAMSQGILLVKRGEATEILDRIEGLVAEATTGLATLKAVSGEIVAFNERVDEGECVTAT